MKKHIAGIFCFLAGVLSVSLVSDAVAESPASCAICAGSVTPPCDTCVSYPEDPVSVSISVASAPVASVTTRVIITTSLVVLPFPYLGLDGTTLQGTRLGMVTTTTTISEVIPPLKWSDCDRGTVLYEGECIPLDCPAGQCVNNRTDNVCVSGIPDIEFLRRPLDDWDKKHMKYDWYMRDYLSSCVVIHDIECPPGERAFSGICHPETCPEGTGRIGRYSGNCVECPAGKVSDEESGRCRHRTLADCAAGEILDEGICRAPKNTEECIESGPFNIYWEGECRRFACTTDKVLNPVTAECECPAGKVYGPVYFPEHNETLTMCHTSRDPEPGAFDEQACLDSGGLVVDSDDTNSGKACFYPIEPSSLSRTPDEVQPATDAKAVQEAAAQLGIAQASYVQQPIQQEENRLPEYAAPAALIGVLAFSSLYPDYDLDSSFDYSGENSDLRWEAGMHSHFRHGPFRSYISAIQDNNEFTIHSGTAYRSDSFLASYTTVEAKDSMNYAVQLSAPWKYSGWEIRPNLSSQFRYDRDKNHSSSESGAGMDLEYRF